MHRWLRRGWVVLALPGLALSWNLRQQRERAARDEALIVAIEQRQPALVEQLLLEGASPVTLDGYGFTALHRAAMIGDRELLAPLLQAGADPNVRDASGNTPLMVASGRNHVEIVEDLLAGGADVHARGNQGWTALHCAASLRHAEMVRLLLHAGAPVTAIRKDRVTPLHLAASSGCAEAVRSLLAAGAPVDAPDRDGTTPLLEAVISRDPASVRLLLAHGADPQAPSRKRHGSSPVARAKADHSWMLVALLRDPVGRQSGHTTPPSREVPRTLVAHAPFHSPWKRSGRSVVTPPAPKQPVQVTWTAHSRPRLVPLPQQVTAAPSPGATSDWPDLSPDPQADPALTELPVLADSALLVEGD